MPVKYAQRGRAASPGEYLPYPRPPHYNEIVISLGKLIIFLGVALVVIGLLFLLLGRTGLPIGRLPGDLMVRRRNFSFYFPLTTSILLSIVLSLVFYLLSRMHR
ncbi:MAG TPA: DUF2905 domain-containing protein [Bryobacteraceae bacterium]|nr:DUF2905 domain-containing protein [Bryobacteraceae bacterium]